VLLAIDLHEDFIDEKGITVASALSVQSSGVNGAELDAPQANCFAADSYASLSEQIFNITMAVTTRLRLKR
jgi:hypothetical protein